MRTVSEKLLANGRRRVVVELEPGETLVAVRDGAHYRLGQPVDEVVAAHILTDSTRVTWCSASQAWVS